ncbi:unnamed protein product [Gadus morhua 'NCC']
MPERDSCALSVGRVTYLHHLDPVSSSLPRTRDFPGVLRGPRLRKMLVLTEEGRGREQHTGRGLGALWMEDRCPTTASGQEDVSWVNGEDILSFSTVESIGEAAEGGVCSSNILISS